jgi:SAM-dependent methyltransferase
MSGYYARKLAGERLRRCYEMAPRRVRQYLEAEVEFVLDRLSPDCWVLELGCGYGRVLRPLAQKAARAVGIDTAVESLRLAQSWLAGSSASLLEMDARELGFRDCSFDVVVCIQNGISAFKIPPHRLMEEAVRVTRAGGRSLFSSYAAQFWQERLAWFRMQAELGLIGEIDEAATGNGVIVCRDGFQATTFGRDDFLRAAAGLAVEPALTLVDGSSLFCELVVR